MKTFVNLSTTIAHTTRFQRGVAALAALLVLATAVAGGIASMLNQGAQPAPAAHMVAPAASAAHAQFAALKQRQLDQLDTRMANTVVRAAAQERFTALKQHQLAQLDADLANAVVPEDTAAQAGYIALKQRQLDRLDMYEGNLVTSAANAARERFQGVKQRQLDQLDAHGR
jgi:hypothetical protein